MDILFIIYIFALFVIFSPNFIFQYSKSNNILVSVLHAIIFSIVLYVTYNSVSKKQTEGATIGTYNKNNDQSSLNVNELTLGGVLDEPPEIDKQTDIQYSNEVVVSSPNAAEEDKLTTMPPYDYSNFRTYDYENMEKKLKMLESHKHTNHYFDLVPNFNENKHEILCAADYGTSKPCCRQPNAFIPESNQCDALKPYCTDYISGKQWGKCVSANPHPKPNLVYDEVIHTPSAPSPAPQVVVKKPTGGEVPAETETKPDGTVVIKNCPALPAPAPAPLADSKTPITQANIQTAVDAWISDPTTATTKYGHIKDWDTSAVTNMSPNQTGIFQGKTTFNDDISGWDVSNVTNMSGMFSSAYAFNQPIGNWDVSKVTNMYGMLYSANNFNQDISDWDVSKVTNMYAMFSNNNVFNQDISGWDVSNVTNMQQMFYGVGSFDQNIRSWDVSKASASPAPLQMMFYNATKMIENQGAPTINGGTPTKAYFNASASA